MELNNTWYQTVTHECCCKYHNCIPSFHHCSVVSKNRTQLTREVAKIGFSGWMGQHRASFELENEVL